MSPASRIALVLIRVYKIVLSPLFALEDWHEAESLMRQDFAAIVLLRIADPG